MPDAPIGLAERLKLAELTEAASDAALYARWGGAAGDVAASSALIAQAAASAEAVRQQALTDKPHVPESLRIDGLRTGLEGRRITIFADAPGYGAGATVYVTGSEFDPADEVTTLFVLRALT